MLRRTSADQEPPMLSDEHSDAIDLIGMLYDNLMKEVKPGGNASALISKLQVPLIRVAVQDPAFLTRPDHPARQLLNTIAETGVHWLGDDDNDPALVNQLHSIVDRAVHDYQGDPSASGPWTGTAVTPADPVAEGRSGRTTPRRSGARKGKAESPATTPECMNAGCDQTLPRFTGPCCARRGPT